MSITGPFDCFSNMALAEYREKSFTEWPFKKGTCTAKQMAKAGFYVTKKDHQVVTCYFCFKELEGWEKNDDPFTEHKKHAPYCEFINMFEEAPDKITLAQLMKLEKARRKREWELQIADISSRTQEIIQKSQISTVKRRLKKRK